MRVGKFNLKVQIEINGKFVHVVNQVMKTFFLQPGDLTGPLTLSQKRWTALECHTAFTRKILPRHSG